MNCYVHNDRPAVGVCMSCGKAVCQECVSNVAGRIYCDSCAARLASAPTGGKSKIAAGLFGILLGGLGVHKFYLGQVGMGILYLLFFWTCIPAIIGLIEGIIYLTMSDEEFARRYGGVGSPGGTQSA